MNYKNKIIHTLMRRGMVGNTAADVMSAMYGTPDEDALSFQQYWHGKNIDYWKSQEAAKLEAINLSTGMKAPRPISYEQMKYVQQWMGANPSFGNIRKVSVPDSDYFNMGPVASNLTPTRQEAIGQSNEVYDQQRRAGEDLYAAQEYERVRNLEESAFRGEHTPEVRELAHGRTSFWGQVNPKNISASFLTGRDMGFTEEEAGLLRSGKAPKDLTDLFSARMSEFELLGHLPKTEFYGNLSSGRESTRVVDFGQYSEEPGAFFSGMLPSGKSSYIPVEQQRSFASNVFGQSKVYRFAGTGKIVRPEQLSKLRVLSKEEVSGELNGLDALEGFRGRTEKLLAQYRDEATQERKGILKYQEEVNPLSHQAVTSTGHKGEMLEAGDDEGQSLYELINREITPQEELSAHIESVNEAALEEAEEVAIDPWSLTGEPLEGSAPLKTETGWMGMRNEIEPAYRIRAGWYKNRYDRLRKLANKAFSYEFLKKKNSMGKMVREKVFSGYNPTLSAHFSRAHANLVGKDISISGKSIEEKEQIIETALGSGGKVKVGYRGGYSDITSAPLENLSQVYLRGAGKGASVPFTSLSQNIPARAEAEQVIDAYFSRITGRDAYSVHTAAGTYLGETAGLGGVPSTGVGYAKIFKRKEYGSNREIFDVGVAPTRNMFAFNRFGEVEKGWLKTVREKGQMEHWPLSKYGGKKPGKEPREINSIYDLHEEFKLKSSEESQANLEKMYYQMEGDYGLISPHRKGMDADIYSARLENEYREKSRLENIARNKSIPKAEKATSSAAGAKMSESWGEKLWNRIPKTKGMIYAALGVSAALLTLGAVNRKEVNNLDDVPRANYGSSGADQRMFTPTPMTQQTARIVPEYQGRQGYSTNIDIHTTDTTGINPSELAYVMDRHARNAMGTRSRGNNVEINDNSSQEDEYRRKRKFANMMT